MFLHIFNSNKKRFSFEKRLRIQVRAFSNELEGIGCIEAREDAAFTLERVTEQQVFSNGNVDLQTFFDVDTKAEADMVFVRTVSQRIGREERTVVLADAVAGFCVGVLGIHVAVGVENLLLTTHADHEPIPPDVTFDTEADLAADIGALVPVRIDSR